MNHTGSIQLFLDTCHLIHAKGLVSGSGGNISLRCDDGILITPSGRSLESLKEEDLVLLQMDGSYTCPNGGIPSKEWRMHLACYRARPDVSAHRPCPQQQCCGRFLYEECRLLLRYPGVYPRLQHARGRAAHPSLYDARFGRTVRPRLPSHRRAQVGASGKSRSFGPWACSMEEALNIIEEIEDEAKLFLLLGDRGIAMTKAQQDALPSHGTALLIGKGGESRI